MSEQVKIKEFTHNAVEFYVEFWKVQKLKELGIDTEKAHEISLATGNIIVKDDN